MLIETADGVISGRNSPEQLIVASNDVAASTAQLVAASRVKASFMSKSQDRLETASKAVTSVCRSLVRQVQEIISQRNQDQTEVVDYAKLSDHEFKVKQMEQQVSVSRAGTIDGRIELTLLPRSRSCSSRIIWRRRGKGWEKCGRSPTRKNEAPKGGTYGSRSVCDDSMYLLVESLHPCPLALLSIPFPAFPQKNFLLEESASVCACTQIPGKYINWCLTSSGFLNRCSITHTFCFKEYSRI